MKVPATMRRRQAPCRRGSGHNCPEYEAEPGGRERLWRRDTGGQTLEQKLAGLRRLECRHSQQEHQLECRQPQGYPDGGGEMKPEAGSQSGRC